MDVVAALGMVVLAAWLVVMAAFTAVCAVAGICLIFGWNIAGLLPSMPLHPQLKKECRLRLRSASVVLVILFVLFLAACVIASAVSAGSLEFWHVWGWFGYGA